MAIALVNLKFGVNLTDFVSDLNQVGREAKKFGRQMQGIGKNLSTYVTAPLAGISAVSVKMAADFDDSMRKVQATSSASAEQFDMLKKKALDMGSSTKFTASESAEAMNYMAMAGWKTTDIMEGLSGIMMGAAASGESLALVSDIVTDGLTAFGLSAKDSNAFVDVLAATASNANTNISMLGDSFKYVAPIAGALGYSVEDVSVGLGLMANAGIKASQSGTALRAIFSRLVKPTKESQQAMEDLGITVSNADGTLKPFSQLLEEMRVAFSILNPEQKAMYAGMLGGQEAMSGLLSMVNAGEADFMKLTTAINQSEGSAKRMSETMEGGIGGSFRSFKSVMEGIIIDLGDILSPIVKQITDYLRGLASSFRELNSSTKTTIVVIGGVLAAIGPLMTGIGFFAASVLPMLISGFSTVAAAVGMFSGPLLLAAAGIVAAGTLIYQNWESIVSYFKGPEISGLFDAVIGAFNEFKQFASAIWSQFIKPKIVDVWSKIGPLITNTFVGAFNRVITVLKMAFNIVAGLFQTIRGVITGDWKMAWEGVKKIFASIWEGILELVRSNIKQLTGYLSSALGFLGLDSWADSVQKFSDSISISNSDVATSFQEVKKSAQEATQAISDFTGGGGLSLESQEPTSGAGGSGSKKKADQGVSGLNTGIPQAFIQLPKTIKGVVDRVKQELTPMQIFMQDFSVAMTDIINQGIVSAFVSMGDAIGTAMANGSSVVAAAGGALLGTMADMLGQLGQLAISAGVAVLGIKAALETLNPFVAIAAGVALIALSSLVKGRMKSLSKSGGGGGGSLGMGESVPARAGGGRILNGHEYLVGERGPEIIRAGMTGTVIPNHQLNSGGGAREMVIRVIGELVGQGSTLKGIIDYETRVQGRTT